ncbi:DUF2909 family protein [Reinekea blandensis]|uniref:DUF2909 domain-containing protein n=1 Tax=Reinekea blandensis MED297 TaxID=314283 RepID=A4BD61_9GAMM|nr:DUF2909 family protein [Reinekea blandensis]EAR09805.1 hypothetical protein MED297_05634 [Reinekea sp. MED297] [Reinekea blandensis MED297]
MLFKVILILLILAMLVSLSGALKSLFTDRDDAQNQSNTFKWLVIRVSLAVAIILVTAIGFFMGELTMGAPWTGRY